jgi:hypothetical protein
MRSRLGKFVGGKLVLASLVAGLLTACASTRDDAPDLTRRLEQKGYSFLPPAEPEWFIAERSPERISLARLGRMDGETFLIEGGHIRLEPASTASQLADFVKEMQQRELAQPRFRIRRQDLSEMRIDTARCVMTHLVAEDRDPGTLSNVVTAMLVESVGTMCVHPANPNLGIALTYTHRSFPEDRDRAFLSRATPLLNTQQFAAPKGRQSN